MIGFNFKHQKINGYWNSYLECNEWNKTAIITLLCQRILNQYVKNDYHKFLFLNFVYRNSQFDNYYDFFESLDDFCKSNNIDFKLNNFTQSNSAFQKLKANLFQRSLCYLFKYLNPNLVFNKDIKIHNGIQYDVQIGNIKIDAKTKNGIKSTFNKDYQLTVAYNSQENNNVADYYCWGINSRQYLKKNNRINFVVAGIIDKNTFYKIARCRKIGQPICNRNGNPTLDKYGQPMTARHSDYVIYADSVNPIQTVL